MNMDRRRKNPTKIKKNWQMRDDDLFSEVEGCRLLIGNTPDECAMLNEYNEYMKLLCPNNLFTPYETCTVAAIGRFSEVNITPVQNMMVEQLDPHIIWIELNSTERFVNPVYQNLEITRVVRPKVVEGQPPKKSFRSQLTIATTNHPDDLKPGVTVKDIKIYKIKLFYNGTVHIPGIVHSDMRDTVPSLLAIQAYLRDLQQNPDIKVDFINAIMRNYKCGLVPPLAIKMGGLMECVLAEQQAPVVPVSRHKQVLEHLRGKFGPFEAFHIMRFMLWGFMPILKPYHSDNKTVGILIKFNRYQSVAQRKDLTIRAVTSGKITFNGANSHWETECSHLWLNYICTKYYREVVYDPDYDFVTIDDEEYSLPLMHDP